MMLPPTFVPGFHDESAVHKMRYNKLGETDMVVSVLGLGAAAYSNIYASFSEDEAIITIREAIKKGVNYIDGGYWYGQGRAEEVIGKALEGIPRKAYYIASKVGRYELDRQKMFDFSAETSRKSIDRSLRSLKLEYLDLIQVHDVEFAPSLEHVMAATMPALEEAVRAGKARHVGVTGEPVCVLQQAVERSPVRVDTVLSYCRDTLIDDTLKQFLPFFQSRGVGVVHASATAMGLLTNAGPPAWHPAPDSMKSVCALASAYCKERGVELGRLAVHHSLSQRGPAVNVVSMASRELLRANLQLVHEGLSAREQAVLQEVRDRFLSKLPQKHWEGVQLEKHRASLARAASSQ
ncbi:uncharacterized protein LOC134532795 isoform X2 [Bacillus rossius redtenbacheri]|uniref:uncharacterized protein LOC134532795 isoform X2 n=1 Tax=Bacillus rossius redtenbacheri TaxID=93214 RepID=UPI002FDEEA93